MLSATEFENVYSWKPYRNDWPVDMDQKDQTILEHFGALIKDMINNEVFECTQTQPGDITNYLEFLCYPSTVKDDNTDQPGILVCVSLCAPIAIYCETVFKKDIKSFAYAFPDPAMVGVVQHKQLKPIETELLGIFEKHQLDLIPRQYATQDLSTDMATNLDSLNFGNKVLHGLFQWREF